MKALVVVDQVNRDSFIYLAIKKCLDKRGLESIKVNPFELIEKTIYFKPEIVFIGNADTYHSNIVRLIRPLVKIIVSIPTEQYFVTASYDHLYLNNWRNYLAVGHNSLSTPAYSLVDSIFTWGRQQQEVIQKALDGQVNVEIVGPIRISYKLKRMNPPTYIGVLIDSDVSYLHNIAYFNHSYFGGEKYSYSDVLMLQLLFQNSIVKLLSKLSANSNFKFIVRPRFSMGEHELLQLKNFLSTVDVTFMIDSTSSLEFLANNSFVIISGNTSASIELQALKIPVINPIALFNNQLITGKNIKNLFGDFYPYRFSYCPEHFEECLDLINEAQNEHLQISPDMNGISLHLENLFSINNFVIDTNLPLLAIAISNLFLCKSFEKRIYPQLPELIYKCKQEKTLPFIYDNLVIQNFILGSASLSDILLFTVQYNLVVAIKSFRSKLSEFVAFMGFKIIRKV